MDADEGQYMTLVIRVAPDSAGAWHVTLEGDLGSQSWPLRPLLLQVTAFRPSAQTTLRGSVSLPSRALSAPFQSNLALADLLAAWLE